MRIVLADDEPFIRSSLALIVKSLNETYEIVGSAKDGEEALQIVKESHPDVLITDIRMPGTDGLQLAENVERLSPETKVIILSGYAEFEYAKSAIDSHVYAYLLKPTKVDELQNTLQKIQRDIDEQKSQTETFVVPEDVKAIVGLIMNIVEKNYSKDISQTWVAEQVNLNPSYLSSMFHAETGKRFSAYLTEVRMKHAAELLINQPQMRIYEVAEKVGYNASKHFMDVFSKYFDMSPKQYREKNIKNSNQF